MKRHLCVKKIKLNPYFFYQTNQISKVTVLAKILGLPVFLFNRKRELESSQEELRLMP